MSIKYNKTLLKGGSLAGTYLMENSHTNEKFVRKEICLVNNREYGYQRWYSQMKKIQRYEVLFPGLFPSFLGCGILEDQHLAFFDMEFIKNAENCHDYVSSLSNLENVKNVHEKIVEAMDRMHSRQLVSNPSSIELYIEEEINRKLADCLLDEEFKEFYEYNTVALNGRSVPSLSRSISDFISGSLELYNISQECFTHGNITLENLLYSEEQDRIYFIDPYEENIIDNCYNEYSQILQSSNSHYEVYNASTPTIEGNNIISHIEIPAGITKFNELFLSRINETLSPHEIRIVKFFEISQFIRMLPFKLHVDREKMFLFYAVASCLVSDFLYEGAS